jgi:hypothetical protein
VRVVNGPLLPLTTWSKCCGAACHCSRSCIVQHFVCSNIGQRTKRHFAAVGGDEIILSIWPKWPINGSKEF